jgi:hypothetical protein
LAVLNITKYKLKVLSAVIIQIVVLSIFRFEERDKQKASKGK